MTAFVILAVFSALVGVSFGGASGTMASGPREGTRNAGAFAISVIGVLAGCAIGAFSVGIGGILAAAVKGLVYTNLGYWAGFGITRVAR